jgi:2-polyprenyl-3-methyl-5-hydroxy-6-metoxy-1,4-benzoquinol methylase
LNYEKFQPKSKIKYLEYIPKDVVSILDVGCGLGEFLFILKERGYKVEGCDIDIVCVKRAKNITEVKVADVHRLTECYPTNSFDLVTCLHVLEHLKSPYEALNEIKKVTKKYALFAVPNARYITFEERETHLFSWNKSTLKNLLESVGFKIIILSEEWINPIPNVLKVSPIFSKILFRILYDPLDLVALVRKRGS